jgi:serine/threonine-protein kinase
VATHTNPEKIGRYQILERVGRGGMGVLYRGIDPVLDREVAIKVMLVDFTEDTEQMRPRFYREAQAAARLQHSNIVTVFEFAEDNNTPYIVMEFLRGEPLSTRMTSPIPLTLDDKINVVAQLCGALHYAHEQGVVHRDIKPANIFLLPDGTVKLLDFGVAKLTTSTLTRQGDVLGSASYMSPEQVGGDTVDGRSDIFSVGVMLYEMLAGQKPFQGDSPTSTIMKILRDDPPPLEETAPGLPPQLVAAVMKTLAKNPADRFSTAAELARELQRIRIALQSSGAGAMTTPGLDETRFASPTQLLALHKELAKDAAAATKGPPVTVAAAPLYQKWLVASGLGVAVVVVAAVAFTTMGRRSAVEVGPVAASSPPVGTPPIAAAPPPAATPAARTAVAPPNGPDAAVAALPKSVVQVDSIPSGAALVVDGQPTSQATPTAITFVGPGPHTLRLSKRGFLNHDVRLTAADLQRGAVSYTLREAEASRIPVTIDSAYPVEVLSGTKVLSPASATHQLSVPSGSRLRVLAREYLLDASVPVSGKSVEYHAPGIGRLTVLTKYETCNIKIGEHMLGFPPISRLPIASGQYRIDVACPNGQTPAGQFVTVAPNETATVRIY